MIMALCVGTPVLPIAYEFKTRELAKRVGVENALLDIDTMTAGESLAKLRSFIDAMDRYRADSLRAVLAEHASAMSAGALLKALLPAALPDVPEDVAGAVEQRVA